MLNRLKQKWNVGGIQFFLILCVFAVTGITTAYITRRITDWFDLGVEQTWYWISKIAVLIFGYQVLILLISIPFGQFNFFWNYEKKMWRAIARLFSRRNKI